MTDNTELIGCVSHDCAACKKQANALEALQAEVARLRRDADELNFLNADLLYWTERAVSKGNANGDIEEAYERYEQWLKARAAITKETP